jgi:hypothetical protein
VTAPYYSFLSSRGSLLFVPRAKPYSSKCVTCRLSTVVRTVSKKNSANAENAFPTACSWMSCRKTVPLSVPRLF